MAKRISNTAVNATLKKSIVQSIKKAFGTDHAIHIKESGPSWVNSPRGDAGEKVVNPIIKKNITVSVNRNR